jgi:hypothetical protein
VLGVAKQKRTDDSIVFRSTEMLGRMIGKLQRQLDGVSKRLSPNGNDTAARRAAPRSKKKNDRARSDSTKRSTAATRPK